MQEINVAITRAIPDEQILAFASQIQSLAQRHEIPARVMTWSRRPSDTATKPAAEEATQPVTPDYPHVSTKDVSPVNDLIDE